MLFGYCFLEKAAVRKTTNCCSEMVGRYLPKNSADVARRRLNQPRKPDNPDPLSQGYRKPYGRLVWKQYRDQSSSLPWVNSQILHLLGLIPYHRVARPACDTGRSKESWGGDAANRIYRHSQVFNQFFHRSPYCIVYN